MNATLWSEPSRGRLLLFGGYVGINARTNDIWEWDGTLWRMLTTAAAPSPRDGMVSAFDALRNRAVLLGGSTNSGPVMDTWEWDLAHWIQRQGTSGPLERTGHALVYDPTRQQCVLFGGVSDSRLLSDVWFYGPDVPGQFAPAGAGCPGTAGTPNLSTVAAQVPWIGASFPVALGNLPAGRSTLLWAGPSNSSWAGVPLPLDLTGAGLPGCFLRVRPTLALPAFKLSGTARVDRWIPDDASLAGTRLHLQGPALDPLVNGFWAVLSNAGECGVGAR